MVARVLAVVVSVAMVVGAIQLRQRLDDSGGGDGRGADRPASADKVFCSTEVGGVCDVAQAAPATATLLLDDQLTLDVWLTVGPWGELVDDARRRANREEVFTNDDQVVARSPIVLVLHRTRGQELRNRCPQLTWRCVGDAAGQGVLIGAAPATEAEGVLVRAAAAAGYLGNPDYARNDLEEDPGVVPWLQGLDRSIAAARQGGALDYGRFLQLPAAAAYVTADALAQPAPDGFERIRLEPVATMDVVLSSRARVDGELRRRIRTLQAAGWLAPGDRSLPRDDGLPSPGVLQALQEVIR